VNVFAIILPADEPCILLFGFELQLFLNAFLSNRLNWFGIHLSTFFLFHSFKVAAEAVSKPACEEVDDRPFESRIQQESPPKRLSNCILKTSEPAVAISKKENCPSVQVQTAN
jgi:hypothetical protein